MIIFFNKTGNKENYIISSNFFSVINRIKGAFSKNYFIIDPYLGNTDILIDTKDEFINYFNNISSFSNIIDSKYKTIVGKEIKYLVVYIEWWNESLRESILFSKYFRSKFKDMKIIYYGPFANGYAKELLSLYPGIIDYIVKNEAEDIIEDIINGKLFNNKIIDGNKYKKSEHFIDFHDYSISLNNLKGKTVEFEFSRGCIIDRCFFCMCTLGKKLRLKPLDIHIKDLNKLLNIGITKFYHVDAEVNSLKPYMNSFLEKYVDIRKNNNFIWSAYLIPKNITYNELKLMYNAGCRHIRIGFESATQSRLNTIAKRTNLKEMITIIKYAKKAGIITQLHCIVGYPYESGKEIENIIIFIKENYQNIDIMNFYHFNPRRTTYSYEKTNLHNIKLIPEKINKYNLSFIKDNIYFKEINREQDYKKLYKVNKLKILLLNKFIKNYGIKNEDPKTFFKLYNEKDYIIHS